MMADGLTLAADAGGRFPGLLNLRPRASGHRSLKDDISVTMNPECESGPIDSPMGRSPCGSDIVIHRHRIRILLSKLRPAGIMSYNLLCLVPQTIFRLFEVFLGS